MITTLTLCVDRLGSSSWDHLSIYPSGETYLSRCSSSARFVFQCMNELYWCSSPIIIIIIIIIISIIIIIIIIMYNYHYTSSLQGVIFYQKGDSLSAIPYIEKALLSNNSHEGFHNSLGQYLLLWWWWWWW